MSRRIATSTGSPTFTPPEVPMKLRPLCFECRHLRPGLAEGGRGTCAAFPGGIPAEIWANEALHLEARAGDGGLHFEVALGEEEPARLLLGALMEPDDGEPYPAPEGEDPHGTPSVDP